MIELIDITLDDVVTYKHVHLKLNEHSLVRVSGKNLDTRSKNSSNGAGKSVLFTTIGSVLLNFVRTNTKKNEKNTLVSNTKSKATINLVKNGIKYTITQYFKGSTRWEIEKNGKPLKFRETKQALHYIKTKIFNISEQQFYSQIVVDGRSKTLLQSGSSRQRFEYFEDVFKLNAYDLLAERVSKDCNRLRQLNQEKEILIKELKQKEEELPIETKQELLDKQEKLQYKFDQIRKKIENLSQSLHTAKTYIAVAENANSSKSLKVLQEDLGEVQKEETDIQKLYEQAVRYKEQSENFVKLNEKRAKIKTQIKKLPKSEYTVDELQNRYSRLEKLILKTQDVIAKEQDVVANNKIINEKLESLKVGNEKLFAKYDNVTTKVIQKTIANNKVERKNLQISIEALQSFIHEHKHNNNSNCPTCLRALSASSAKLMIKTAKLKADKCASNIKKLQALLKYNELKENLQPFNENINVAELEIKLINDINKNNKRFKLIEKLRQKEKLQSLLENIPKPNMDMTRCPPPEVYTELNVKIKQRISILTKAIDIKLRLKKLNLEEKFASIEEAKNKKIFLTEKLEEYRPLIDKIQASISRINSKLSVLDTIQKDVVRLQETTVELKTKTKDLRIYEALRKAFGPKGLRKTKTIYFANKLESNLNKYASLIYNEPIRFQINVSNTRLDILAERNGNIDDVRSLSGAESSKFTLLMILCMLPFVRTEDRFNILVLDEIEVGMDEASKELFVNKFLPVLQQVVKHIYIVSPQAEQNFYLPNAHKITIIKQNNVSTLKES